jgi:hypothetical protein
MHSKYQLDALKGTEYLEDVNADGRITLKRTDLQGTGYDDSDQINLAQDTGHWRGLLYTAMGLHVPLTLRHFSVSAFRLPSDIRTHDTAHETDRLRMIFATCRHTSVHP